VVKPARAAAVLLVCAAAGSACAPDESSVGAVNQVDGGGPRDGRVPWRWWRFRRLDLADLQAFDDLPLSAVTGVAASPDGIVVGGVSSQPDLFWDAWLIPSDDGSPRRLAPIGDRLVGVEAAGAVWTGVVSEDEHGTPAYEVRLSPADGSAAVLLSPDLPADFSADLSVPDGHGGRLLIGTQDGDGSSRLSAFAVDRRGRARRLGCPTLMASPIILNAALGGDALQVEVQFTADGSPAIVSCP
jgi:hypothetical protein